MLPFSPKEKASVPMLFFFWFQGLSRSPVSLAALPSELAADCALFCCVSFQNRVNAREEARGIMMREREIGGARSWGREPLIGAPLTTNRLLAARMWTPATLWMKQGKSYA